MSYKLALVVWRGLIFVWGKTKALMCYFKRFAPGGGLASGSLAPWKTGELFGGVGMEEGKDKEKEKEREAVYLSL